MANVTNMCFSLISQFQSNSTYSNQVRIIDYNNSLSQGDSYNSILHSTLVKNNSYEFQYSSGYGNVGNDCVLMPFLNHYNHVLSSNGTNELSYNEVLLSFESFSLKFTNSIILHTNNAIIKSIYYKIGANYFNAHPNETISLVNPFNLLNQSLSINAFIGEQTHGNSNPFVGISIIVTGVLLFLSGTFLYLRKFNKRNF